MPLEAALGQKLVRLRGLVEARLVAVEMKDPTALEIEVDVLALGHREHMAAGLDRETYRFDGILSVVRDIADELRHPRILVPTRRRIHEKGCVAPQHPAHSLPHRRCLVPDLGITCGELPTVRERGLHPRVAVLIEDRDVVPTLAERVSGGNTCDSCTDDADTSHRHSPRNGRRKKRAVRSPKAPCPSYRRRASAPSRALGATSAHDLASALVAPCRRDPGERAFAFDVHELGSVHGSRRRCIERHAVDLDQVAMVQLRNRHHRTAWLVVTERFDECLIEYRPVLCSNNVCGHL